MSEEAGDVFRILKKMLHSVKEGRRCCIVSKEAGDVLSILEKMLHSVKGGSGCIEDTGEDVA